MANITNNIFPKSAHNLAIIDITSELAKENNEFSKNQY